MNNRLLTYISAIFLAVFALYSCSKDPVYEQGDYIYDNYDLTQVDYVNGIVINWTDSVDINEEQRTTILNLINNLVLVEGGTFLMGAQNTDEQGDNYDAEAQNSEGTVHEVTLSSFYMGKFEITQREWRTIMGYDLDWSDTYGKGDSLPAYNITRTEAVQFVEKLNAMTRLSFQLPSEAQWEFAARGGNHSQHYLYSGSNNVEEVAWHKDNTGNILHPVGGKLPNELGLFDMSGSLWEWCLDTYGEYPDSPQTNPVFQNGNPYAMRGGAWTYLASYCRVSCRDPYDEHNVSIANGLRVVMKIQ